MPAPSPIARPTARAGHRHFRVPRPRPALGRLRTRTSLVVVALAALSSIACSPGESREARATGVLAPDTPVVLIVVDTLRADHLGCYGYELETSPALDAFAGQATVFEEARTQANSTYAALTSILTGLYLKSHRGYLVVPSEEREGAAGVVDCEGPTAGVAGGGADGSVEERAPGDATHPGFDALPLEAASREAATEPREATVPREASPRRAGSEADAAATLEGSGARRPVGANLAERFSARGYATRAVVTHPGWSDLARRAPLFRGFETLSTIDPSLAPEERVARTRGRDTNARLWPLLDARDESRPPFLWVHYFEPHTDKWPNVYDPPAAERDRFLRAHLAALGVESYEGALTALAPGDRPEWIRTRVPEADRRAVHLANGRALYDAEIRSCDAALGALFERLRADGLFDRALIAVLADHGENMGSLDESSEQAPVAFSHERVFRGVARTPFLLKLPGQREGRRIDALVQNIDLAPTLIELCALPAEPECEGRSLVPLLRGERTRLHERVFVESTDYVEKALVDERLKWIERGENGRPLVFDWRADPGETTDLFERTAPERRAALDAAMRAFEPVQALWLHFEPGDEAVDVELDLLLDRPCLYDQAGTDAGRITGDGRGFRYVGRLDERAVDLVLLSRRRNAAMDWRLAVGDAWLRPTAGATDVGRSSAESGGGAPSGGLERHVWLGRTRLDHTTAIPAWEPGEGEPPTDPLLVLAREPEHGRLKAKLWPRGRQRLVLEARYAEPDYDKRIYEVFLDGFGPLEISSERAFVTRATSERPVTAVLGRTIGEERVHLLARIDGAWPPLDAVVVDGRPARLDELRFAFPHPLDGRITDVLMSERPTEFPPGSLTIWLESGGGPSRFDTERLDPKLVEQLRALGYVR